jgi:hypothetical protein
MRKRTRKAGAFNIGKAGQLLIGHDYFGDGYGAERDDLRSHPEIVAQMKRDWFMFKDRIMSDHHMYGQLIWHERSQYGSVWAEREFEGVPERIPTEAEREQLLQEFMENK